MMTDEQLSPPRSSSGGTGTVAPYIVVVTSPHGSSTAALEPGRAYAIGRRTDSDIHLDDPSVAEDHAILFGGDPPAIVDLGVSGGTTLHGRTLEPRVRHPLDGASVLRLGHTTLTIQRAGASAAPAPAAKSAAKAIHADPDVLAVPLGGGQAFVTRNAGMRELYARIRRVARTDVAVLLLGETGVGKEVVAHAIHHASPRRAEAWLTVNCAAIPENLMESEFFGYERGAFSGAVTSKPGLFEAADRGTLFLDEVAELPKSLQAKLLRVLETGEVQRIGAVKGSRVDVRIVAATNGDIAGESAAGTFRSDLYYRLNGMSLFIPPLRDRVDDIPLLAAHFARRMGGNSPPTFSAAALAALQAHPWRGNVRELRAVVERALILSEGEHVVGTRHLMFDPTVSTVSALPDAPEPSHHRGARGKAGALPEVPAIAAEPKGHAPAAPHAFGSLEASTGRVAAELKAELERREQKKIRAALARAAGNQTDAAKILGVSRRTLINRMERYRIERPRKKSGDQG